MENDLFRMSFTQRSRGATMNGRTFPITFSITTPITWRSVRWVM